MNTPEDAIGRPQRDIDLSMPRYLLQADRILVTGAAGAVGQPLVATMREMGLKVIPTDVDTTAPWGCHYMNVCDFQNVMEVVHFHEPTVIINLAAAKLAPAGEEDPWRANRINTQGVKNLLDVKGTAHLVQASTCKAIEPETAYGAAKLISERMVLNQGGTVVRYVNIPECGPSVYTIWRDLPEDQPLPVTPCTRFFMTYKEAIALTLWGCVLPAGQRYKLDSGQPLLMKTYAENLYPGRKQEIIPLRRGDRIAEPLCGHHERIERTPVPFIDRVVNNHDVLEAPESPIDLLPGLAA